MVDATISNRDDVRRAAELIRAGRLVAFPTETVYGLGANALDPGAVARIYSVKGRPPTSPVIVHVSSPQMAIGLLRHWPASAEALAQRYWPGPLTLVLPKQPIVPDLVTAGLPAVGVRMPAHPLALALIEAAGVPIAAPSANRFSQLSPTTADHVREALGSSVDMILNGGPTTVGIESTVLALEPEPVLLRPGMVSRAAIEEVIGPVTLGSSGQESAHLSPGLHSRHYSPTTPLFVAPEPFGNRCAWIFWDQERKAAGTIRLAADPETYARVLYSVLHQLDNEGYDRIVVEPVPQGPEWAAIRDRLARASAKGEE